MMSEKEKVKTASSSYLKHEAQKQDFQWFMDNLDDLFSQYGYCHLAIKDKTVLGSYDSFEEAIEATEKTETPGTFIIQECSDDPNANTIYVCSPLHVIPDPAEESTKEPADNSFSEVCLGKIVDLEDNIHIEGLSKDVSLDLDIFLAVILRDLIKVYRENTNIIGNCAFQSLTDEGLETTSEAAEKRWNDLLEELESDFDKMVKYLNDWSVERDIFVTKKQHEEYLKTRKRALSLLEFVWDDLVW